MKAAQMKTIRKTALKYDINIETKVLQQRTALHTVVTRTYFTISNEDKCIWIFKTRTGNCRVK